MYCNKRLEQFFKDVKGLKTNRAIAAELGYSEVMIGRFFKEEKLNQEFILKCAQKFPDIDWNYVFHETNPGKSDLDTHYTCEEVLNQIEEQIRAIRNKTFRHKKSDLSQN